jgi:soluble lytic murein transglycosylase
MHSRAGAVCARLLASMKIRRMNFTHLSYAWRRCLRAGLVLGSVGLAAAAAQAQAPVQPLVPAWRGGEAIVEARDALRRADRARLASLRAATAAAQNPLAMWVDYWELNQRLLTATQAEVSEFYARWPDTYVEDRLRNDWLLELGRRRDWAHFAGEFARFRMNDDREVNCYALLLRHQAGEDVTSLARSRWLARRDTDDGCTLLATTLYQERRLGDNDVWLKLRTAAEFNRARVARPSAALISEAVAASVGEVFDQPARYLAREASRRGGTLSRKDSELLALALVRLADSDAAAAAAQLDERWATCLPQSTLTWVWAAVAKQAAMDLHPRAHEWYRRAAAVRGAATVPLSDDMLAWKARAALRAEGTDGRWEQLLEAVEAMSPAEQRDPAWVYWKARALKAAAPPEGPGETQRAQATALLEYLAGQLHFYGKLSAEELGRPQVLPRPPVPLTPEERARAQAHPGLTRALALIGLGLRDEGVREWNFSLRGMDDRELRAAAARACAAEVWDRCINTSDRTVAEVDFGQRFPTPFRRDIEAVARETGLDPAYMYGVIRQESRFVVNVRSAVGASGLMQLMPGTARWTARKIGLAGFRPDMINDPGTNLRLGAGYLKLVLDNFGGSQALAAAAYNAGPNRPRRWRDGPTLEVAAWAENIPFTETRDYVKKVLSNATYYGAVLRGEMISLKNRMAVPIGPPLADAPPDSEDLP